MLPGFMILWLVVGAVLLAAAALKAADRSGSVVALSGYGVPGRLAGPAWVALVAAEAGLAAGIGAGLDGAAYAAGALLAVFMTVQLVALAGGGAGAPCGCFGGRGRLSRASAARTGLLGAACAALPLAGPGPDLPLALTAAVAAGGRRADGRPPPGHAVGRSRRRRARGRRSARSCRSRAARPASRSRSSRAPAARCASG